MIQKLTVGDLDNLDNPSDHTLKSGDVIVRSMLQTTWPVATGDHVAELARLRWANGQIRHMLLHDPSAHFIKAVDTTAHAKIYGADDTGQETGETAQALRPGNEIAGILRWHRYAHGHSHDDTVYEAHGPTGYSSDMKADLHDAMCRTVFAQRDLVMGKTPYWCKPLC